MSRARSAAIMRSMDNATAAYIAFLETIEPTEECICTATEPDYFGNRDQIVNPDCPTCA